MKLPEHLKYSESHEWIDPSDPGAAPVGITDYAQERLKGIVYLELPEAGRQFQKGESIAVIDSDKAANEIYAIVSGEVVAVNEALAEDPAAVNADPYGAGWMIRVKLTDETELGTLLDAEAYRKLLV